MNETRAEKAQRLVDEGGVHIMSQGDVYIEARVGRNEQGRAYHTFLYPNGHYSCNCTWARIHGPVHDLCAHAVAVRLVVEKEKER